MLSLRELILAALSPAEVSGRGSVMNPKSGLRFGKGGLRGARVHEYSEALHPGREPGRGQGFGSTGPHFRVRTSPRVCRPVPDQPRTSVQFRQLRRAGFEVRQRAGVLFAVPLTGAANALVGGEAVEIGRTIR